MLPTFPNLPERSHCEVGYILVGLVCWKVKSHCVKDFYRCWVASLGTPEFYASPVDGIQGDW